MSGQATVAPDQKCAFCYVAVGLLEFGKALLAPADPDDEYLVLPHDHGSTPCLPDPLTTSIYIRPLYRKLLAKVDAAAKRDALIITGSPGNVLERRKEERNASWSVI